jgi:hypothetical protein
MSVLSDINSTLGKLGIPLETGVFSETAPDTYIVVVPLTDTFGVNADNSPTYDVQEARISLYSKGNYGADKNRIVRLLLSEDFSITGRQYIGFEADTGYHHYVVDVAKHYEMEE